MNEKDRKNSKSLQKPKMSFSYAHNFHPSSLDAKNMFMAKKAHKIMSAVYIITELLPENEPLRIDARRKSTTLISKIFRALSDPIQKRTESISKGQNLLEQTLCLLETMQMVGYISEMNVGVLTTEVYKLQENLSQYFKESLVAQKRLQANANRREMIFDDDFFGSDDMNIIQKSMPVDLLNKKEEKQETKHFKQIDSRENTQGIKKPEKQTNFVKDNIKDINKGQETIRDTSNQGQILNKKGQRQDAIIDVLMRRREAQLPEICSECMGYSSKTIQRDLKELIQKGIVIRKGDRRWSIYSLFVG